MHTLRSTAVLLRSCLLFCAAIVMAAPASAQYDKGPWEDCGKFTTADQRTQCAANNKEYPAIQEVCKVKAKGGRTTVSRTCADLRLPYPDLRDSIVIATDAGPLNDCRTLADAGLKKLCVEINTSYKSVRASCSAANKVKGKINTCVEDNMPKEPPAFVYESTAHFECRQQVATAVVPKSCTDNERAYSACPWTGNAFKQADCLIKFRAGAK